MRKRWSAWVWPRKARSRAVSLVVVAVFFLRVVRVAGAPPPRLSFLPGLSRGLFSLIFRGFRKFVGVFVNMCQ